MKWHPDRWSKRGHPNRLLDEANRKFQSIHEAYQVLSDRRKRTMYDAGMYDEEEKEVERFAEFVEEMADQRRKEGLCGLPELRAMLDDERGEEGSYRGDGILPASGRVGSGFVWECELMLSPVCFWVQDRFGRDYEAMPATLRT